MLNLKFASVLDRVRSELQIQEAYWNHWFASVAGDSEIRCGPSIDLANFRIATLATGPA
jgi:hypothetical protein